MKRKTFLFLNIFIIVLFILLFILIYDFLLVDKYRLKYDFRVSTNVGFNADVDYMHFGGVPLGGSAFRSFSVNNDECDVCNVKIKVRGGGKDWILLSEDSFRINKNQTKSVLATLRVPSDTRLGVYSGEFVIYFWKVI